MKKLTAYLLVLVSTFMISTTAFAVITPSWYLGLQLGQTDTNYSASDFDGLASATPPFASVSVDSDGFGGRAYAGYQHNENFAFEVGYTYFAKTDVDGIPIFGENEQEGQQIGSTDGDVRQYALDASVKAMFPLTYGLAVYGRLGVAFVNPDESGSLPDVDDEFNFVYGAGISYDLLPNVVIDFSYTRINGSGDVQDTELTAVGLQYHFGMVG